MPTPSQSKPRKKTPMSNEHKAALAKGRDEGRIVRRYLESLEASKPRRARKRSTETLQKRLDAVESALVDADPLARLHLTEERQRLQAELASTTSTVDRAELEKKFVRVARDYSERKGISYSAWRAVGVSANVLQQAKISRTRA